MGILEHHGTKGMKWGVRKDAGHEGETAKSTKIAKLDKKFESNRSETKAYYKTWREAAAKSNQELHRINNKPEYKNQDFRRDSPLRQKYYKEHEDAFLNNLEKAASAMGTNASGTKKYAVHELPNGSWRIVTIDVKHSEDDGSFDVKVTYDSSGYITGIEMPDDTVAHGAAFTSEFLAHHGVKGMKWGTRKGSTSSPHPPSDDHITVEAHKAKIKSSGVKALSNDELNKVVERMNLEQRHRDLVDKQPSKFTHVEKGDAHVKKVLKVGKTMADIYNLANSPAGKAAKVAVKKLAK